MLGAGLCPARQERSLPRGWAETFHCSQNLGAQATALSLALYLMAAVRGGQGPGAADRTPGSPLALPARPGFSLPGEPAPKPSPGPRSPGFLGAAGQFSDFGGGGLRCKSGSHLPFSQPHWGLETHW